MPETATLPTRTDRGRRRWYRVHRVLSAGVGAIAIGAAVALGVNAPTSSPVQTAVAAPAAAPAPAVVGDGTAAGGTPVDRSGGGSDAGRGHDDGTRAVRFEGHHR